MNTSSISSKTTDPFSWRSLNEMIPDLDSFYQSVFTTSPDGKYMNDKVSFPPYNIKKRKKESGIFSTYSIELALAGYHRNDIEVNVNKDVLRIFTRDFDVEDTTEDPHEYLHRGIAAREFSINFKLANDAVVDYARFESGMLTIGISRNDPEGTSLKVIDIG